MADNKDSDDQLLRGDPHHTRADKYGQKFVDKAEKYEHKARNSSSGGSNEKKEPAGGFDATPIPKAPPGYTLRITFHRAENLPFADVPTFSSDPYIMAVIRTDLQKRHKQDSDLRLRTPTVHRNVNPKWETVWTIAHMPLTGFHMKCRLYDEDPTDHDDRLGNVHVTVSRIDDNWTGFKEQKFEVKKRMGSKRAYTIRGCAALISRNIKMGGEVYISVENLGRSEGDGGRPYTISPLAWSQHFSPLIGLIAGTKNKQASKNGKKSTERYNFQAIQMQFQGPVPEHLYHRYVEFRPFVAGMFTSHTLRGRILNHALHHQHARIYNYDGSTKYGEYEKPCIEMTKKFLNFVNFDQGGRIFTYVITLDGQWRFTETGKEFGIDLLSKHTMHSDVSIYIAFSGEFFVRRLKSPHKNKDSSPDPGKETMPPAPDQEEEDKAEQKEEKHETHEKDERMKHAEGPGVIREHHETLAPPVDHHTSGQERNDQESTNPRRRSWSPWRNRSHSATSSTRSPAPHAEQTHEAEDPSEDPSHYELIIDNDSGTYRPNAKYLGELKKFLQHNLPGLRVATLDCQKDAEKMGKLKNEQRERKKKSGKQITYMQNLSMSSLSSSDEDELQRRANTDAENEERGVVKTQWNRVKQVVKKGDHHDAGSEHERKPNGEGSKPEKEGQHDNDEAGPPKNHSTSTGADQKSFDTATEHGDGHFVTPKPSLGGMKAFETQDDRPLSRGIEDELRRRGIGGSSYDDVPKEYNEKTIASVGNGSKQVGRGVHQAVTTAP